MIALTLAVLFHGKVLGVLPNVERFAYYEDCEARGRALAKLVKRPKGGKVHVYCYDSYGIKS